jgi:hypothetical protein
VAAIGNRSQASGGRWTMNDDSGQLVQTQAWVYPVGTGGASPSWQLPSLQNLDVTSSQPFT